MNLWYPRRSLTVVAGSQIGRGSWMTSRRHTCCSIPNRFAVAVHPTGESAIGTSRGWNNDHTNCTQQTFIAVHSTNNCFTPGDTKECHLRPLFRFERHPRQVSLISNSIVGIILEITTSKHFHWWNSNGHKLLPNTSRPLLNCALSATNISSGQRMNLLPIESDLCWCEICLFI